MLLGVREVIAERERGGREREREGGREGGREGEERKERGRECVRVWMCGA